LYQFTNRLSTLECFLPFVRKFYILYAHQSLSTLPHRQCPLGDVYKPCSFHDYSPQSFLRQSFFH
jgi:hypothetical protein